jgi:hypothetical protein
LTRASNQAEPLSMVAATARSAWTRCIMASISATWRKIPSNVGRLWQKSVTALSCTTTASLAGNTVSRLT